MDCGMWSGCRLEPWRLYGVRAGLLGEDQKKKGKIERNKNKIFYLLNIIGIIYGPWASGGPGQVPLLSWLRAGPVILENLFFVALSARPHNYYPSFFFGRSTFQGVYLKINGK